MLEYEVVVVGGGLSGVAAGVPQRLRLKRFKKTAKSISKLFEPNLKKVARL